MAGAPATIPGNESLFRGINDFAASTGWLHGPLVFYAKYGPVLFAGLLVAGWWVARRSGEARRMAVLVWTAVGTLLAVALNQPIGHAVAEARPYTAMPHALVLVARTSDYSFPSDHSVMAGAVVAGLLFVHRKLGLYAVGAAVLLAFCRVYVGAHYPIDVLAGLALGAVVVLAGMPFAPPLLTPIIETVSRSRLRPLVTATR